MNERLYWARIVPAVLPPQFKVTILIPWPSKFNLKATQNARTWAAKLASFLGAHPMQQWMGDSCRASQLCYSRMVHPWLSDYLWNEQSSRYGSWHWDSLRVYFCVWDSHRTDQHFHEADGAKGAWQAHGRGHWAWKTWPLLWMQWLLSLLWVQGLQCECPPFSFIVWVLVSLCITCAYILWELTQETQIQECLSWIEIRRKIFSTSHKFIIHSHENIGILLVKECNRVLIQSP